MTKERLEEIEFAFGGDYDGWETAIVEELISEIRRLQSGHIVDFDTLPKILWFPEYTFNGIECDGVYYKNAADYYFDVDGKLTNIRGEDDYTECTEEAEDEGKYWFRTKEEAIKAKEALLKHESEPVMIPPGCSGSIF